MMTSKIEKLHKRGFLNDCPVPITSYEVIMGSVAYGVSSDTSDMDIYSFAVPPLVDTFPHVGGYIDGFGTAPKRFTTYQKHHVVNPANPKQSYDINIYSIVKYFELCRGCNPNMIDSLYVPDRCILFSDAVGKLVRENRGLFLSKRVKHTFLGYSFSQMHKMKTKKPIGKRAEDYKEFKIDRKFAYHVVRLLNEAEQILSTGTLDLEQEREQLKAIRAGEVTMEQIEQHFNDKAAVLEDLYNKSTLPYENDEVKLKTLLLNCLEEAYGNLANIIKISDDCGKNVINEIKEALQKYNL